MVSNPESRFDDVELGVHCAKCGRPIIRGAMPYKKVGDEYYHEWCLENQLGTCYEDAWRFLIKQDLGEVFLIHGTVESLGKRIGHAWVELLTGWVWEPQTAGYFTIKDFDVAAIPLEEQRYTGEEAAIMVARTGNMGPWSDEERT